MKIIKAGSYDEMSAIAAGLVSKQIKCSPNSVLGLATGSTPIGMYKNLVEENKKGEIDFSNVKTINLDEYVGISPTHESSYTYFMKHYLFDHVNIDQSNCFLPNSSAKNHDEECKRYDNLIDQLGSIDLQILGIGNNGHIGFNEPMDSFAKKTHVIKLTKGTIKTNSRLFENPSDIPTKAITMGIQSIMMAKKIILLANGMVKSDIMYKSLFGPITPLVPASVLQLHQNLTVVGDSQALSLFD
ncbi:MAG: glucosamine-6-phosphate deaminase [Clostridiales bacterium]|nr:glucosamine-6-phosphate deaminase [Clostridiales bacterium]